MTYYYTVAVSNTPLPALSYTYHQPLLPGIRVLVSIGTRQQVGLILAEIPEPQGQYTIKPILNPLDTQPLWTAIEMRVLHWCQDYYHAPWGRLLETILPTKLRRISLRQRKQPQHTPPPSSNTAQLLTLNSEQQAAVTHVQQHSNQFKVWLLMGVTGSGKTEVYAHLIHQQLNLGKQVLMLVPEIGLTTPMVQRLAHRLGIEPLQLHSERTDSQREQIWHNCRQGQPCLLIGTRSAIFTPLPNLGLILVDEEHDSAYKQQEGIRYHARDIAIVRAQHQQIPIMLGSATPSLETLANVERQRFYLLKLTQRIHQYPLPSLHTIDMRQQSTHCALSTQLRQAIEQTLNDGKQVLLFLNRRGYAPVLLCHDCGQSMNCPACDLPYTFHRHQPHLRCHHCGKVSYHSQHCPQCGASSWHLLGQGTQQIEEHLQHHFPNTPILRIDRDSTQGKHTLTQLLATIEQGQPCIILGTQMLAKGHDFAHIALVGIIDVDSALFARDFRALERLAQLVTQVAGRAGRAKTQGKVLLQTHQPQHPFIQRLLTQSYPELAHYLLQERQQAELPPYTHSAWLLAEGKQLARVQQQLTQLLTQIPACPQVHISGPIPALIHKRQHYFRELLWLQSANRRALHQCINHLLNQLQQPEIKQTGIRIFLDVDPQDMP